MKRAEDSPFAKRMAEKPMPASLSSDPEARLFYDPPELIQQAFGGRPWFWEIGNTRVHRIGLLKGLGWSLDPVIAREDERGITDVRVTARAAIPGKPQLYDMLFMACQIPEDHLDPIVTRGVDHRSGLTADQLKPTYAEVLGEHAI